MVGIGLLVLLGDSIYGFRLVFRLAVFCLLCFVCLGLFDCVWILDDCDCLILVIVCVCFLFDLYYGLV